MASHRSYNKRQTLYLGLNAKFYPAVLKVWSGNPREFYRSFGQGWEGCAYMCSWRVKTIFKIIMRLPALFTSFMSIQWFFSSDYMMNDSIRDLMQKQIWESSYNSIKPVIRDLQNCKTEPLFLLMFALKNIFHKNVILTCNEFILK